MRDSLSTGKKPAQNKRRGRQLLAEEIRATGTDLRAFTRKNMVLRHVQRFQHLPIRDESAEMVGRGV
jgi:hypothetical protein